MKRIFTAIAVSVIFLSGCSSKDSKQEESNTVDNIILPTSYSQNEDNTYTTTYGENFKYKLTLKGKMTNSQEETTLTILSNDENITFDEVYKHMFGSGNESYEFMQKIRIVEYN